jgi:hypothetical protein
LFIYREHYVAGQLVAYHADKVAEMSVDENILWTVIDPSTKSTRGATGKKVDKEWKICMKKHEPDFRLKYGVNSVNAGIARVHRYLRIDKNRKHFVTGKPGAPKLYIFNTCTTTIDEVETYKWKKIQPTSEDDPQEAPRKRDDHTVDVVRYMIMEIERSLGHVITPDRVKDTLDTIVKSKRDQILPSHITDKAIMDEMKRQHPEDFLLPY